MPRRLARLGLGLSLIRMAVKANGKGGQGGGYPKRNLTQGGVRGARAPAPIRQQDTRSAPHAGYERESAAS